jgi:hypothetical protein
VSDKTPNYRMAFLTHWLNLSFLAGGIVIGLASGGMTGLFVVLGIEVAFLWILPDLALVQRFLTVTAKTEDVDEQRWYYLRSLWGLEPDQSLGFLGAVFGVDVAWHQLDLNPDSGYRRVRNQDSTMEHKRTFLRMCEVVHELRKLHDVRKSSISTSQIRKLDEMINNWLALHNTAKDAKAALLRMDKDSLRTEFGRLREQAAEADPSTRIVISERLRTLKSKVESIPKLERREGLAVAQAEGIAHHIEKVNQQVRSAGMADVSSKLLDTTVDNLVDVSVIDDLEVISDTRDALSGTSMDDDGLWEEIGDALK